jgi:membrane-associated protease RseP (regulator of RpoE activity)
MLLPLLAALLLPAQDDPAAQKKKILEDVEKRLKAQDEKLLKDIERIIDEEQRRAAGRAPAPAPVPAPAPRAEAPAKKARGYLGIRPADLSDDERKAAGVKNGVKVEDVVAGGPAEKAGLRKGDVIVAVDGRAVDSPLEVPAIVQAAGAGSTLAIEYVRGKDKGTAKAVLAPHPMDVPSAAPAPPKPAPPGDQQQGRAEDDLRERMKKLLEKKEEAPAPQAKPGEPRKPAPPQEPPAEGNDPFAFDEGMFEQFRGLLEQFGMDPEQFFEKGKDGKYRFNQDWGRLFKDLDLEQLFKNLPKGVPGLPGIPGFEDEAPAPQAKPRRAPPEGPLPNVYLGLLAEEASDDLRAQLDLDAGVGVFVGAVAAGSPAEQAGLKKNDVVVKMDGKPVRGKAGLADLLRAAKPGQEVTLTVLRKAKEQTLKVTLGERKEE